jgi:hypothetical protein
MYRFFFIFLFALLSCVMPAQPPVSHKTEVTAMSKAQDYINAFKSGEDFHSPAIGVFVDGQPDSAALQLLGKELSVAEPAVREKIVALLVDMGLSSNATLHKGSGALHHSQIIDLLANDVGHAALDLGREAAMEALRKLVPQPDLARHGLSFLKALAHKPTQEAFLLVAKAKPQNAKTQVDQLAQSAEWKDVEEAKIARAALGDKEIEDEFLDGLTKAEIAKDGKAFKDALDPLSLIGTKRSLKAIAERLRTPLTFHMVGAFERSSRLDVLEALLYNFPDQPVLYPSNIISEADYLAAERFCTKTLGITYNTPAPPFLTQRGYPFF